MRQSQSPLTENQADASIPADDDLPSINMIVVISAAALTKDRRNYFSFDFRGNCSITWLEYTNQ